MRQPGSILHEPLTSVVTMTNFAKALQWIVRRQALHPWHHYAICVSEKTNILPSALMLGKKYLKELTAGPIYIGGSAAIYQGQLGGRTVAVKQFRVCQETQSSTTVRVSSLKSFFNMALHTKNSDHGHVATPTHHTPHFNYVSTWLPKHPDAMADKRKRRRVSAEHSRRESGTNCKPH